MRLLFGSIAARLYWQTLLLSVAPMLAIAVVTLTLSTNLIRRRMTEDSQAVARQAATALAQRASTASNATALIAGSPALPDLVQSDDVTALAQLLAGARAGAGIDALTVSGSNGDVIAGVGATGERPPATFGSAEGVSPGTWTLVDSSNEAVLWLAAPVRDATGATVATLACGIDIDRDLLHSLDPGAHRGLALISDEGLSLSTLPLSAPAPPLGRSGTTRSITLGSTHYFAAYESVRGPINRPLTVVSLMRVSALAGSTGTLWLMLLGIMICGCLVVFIITRGMVRRVITPFHRLVSALMRVRDGDFHERIPASGFDELGTLHLAVNNMVDSIGERARERARYQNELRYLASHDLLTGLPNRAMFREELELASEQARRGASCVLVYLDFDQFKIVNDTLGHASGDRLLAQLAGELRIALRQQDLLARLGGDEFAVLFPGMEVGDAVAAAERLRQAVNDFRFVEHGASFALGVSVGLTPLGPSGSASESLRQADVACYMAKVEGRNRVRVYSPDDAARDVLSDDGLWTVELKDALKDGRLRLVFQPIIQLRGRSVDHYEVLVRLINRAGDLVKPPAFIPAAERSGLIRDLDHWVINAALDRMSREGSRGNPVNLAINLSGSTLDGADASEGIRQIIRAKGVDPRALTFEIAEAALRTSVSRRQANIELLRDIGCSIALDGFGAESSAFRQLSALPVDSVKIDGSFVRDVSTNSVNRSIVRAIALIMHSLGKSITAEWVEDSATLSILRRFDVDLAQGHFIGYPSSRFSGVSWRGRRRTSPRLSSIGRE